MTTFKGVLVYRTPSTTTGVARFDQRGLTPGSRPDLGVGQRLTPDDAQIIEVGVVYLG